MVKWLKKYDNGGPINGPKVPPIKLNGTEVYEHGEDSATADKLENGVNPTDLTQKGIKYAKQIGKQAAQQGKKAVISSDIQRAKETADLMANEAGMQHTTSPLLRTWDIGEYDGAPEGSFKEKQWVKNPNTVVPGGEPFSNFAQRMEQAYDMVKKAPANDDIITHSKVTRAFKALESTGGQWTDKTTKKFSDLKDEPKKENGGWLNKYEQGGLVLKQQPHDNYGKQSNYNDAKASTGPGFVGLGYGASNWKSPAWGGQFQNGGSLHNKAWVDSVNNANMDKDFVQRYYAKNNPPAPIHLSQTPSGEMSTHYMADADNMVFPTVVNPKTFNPLDVYTQPGNLQYLDKPGPVVDRKTAGDYARRTGEYIDFKNEQDAQWYSNNGYKKGTGVLNSIDKGKAYNNPNYAMGGDITSGDPIEKVLLHQPAANFNYALKKTVTPYKTNQEIKKNTKPVTDPEDINFLFNYRHTAHADPNEENATSVPYEGDKHWNIDRFITDPQFGIGYGRLKSDDNSIEAERRNTLADMFKYQMYQHPEQSKGKSFREAKRFVRNEIDSRVNGPYFQNYMRDELGAYPDNSLDITTYTKNNPFFEAWKGTQTKDVVHAEYRKNPWDDNKVEKISTDYLRNTKKFSRKETKAQIEKWKTESKSMIDNYYKPKSINQTNVGEPIQELAMGGAMPGAVGFTYARTAGSAPANGKYTKKTKASAQNGKEMSFYQNGLDFTPKSISKNGSVIEDDMGQWAHPGEITEISGNTMATHGYGDIPLYVVPDKGEPRIVEANTGMHKFPGATKFTEYPMAQNGDWLNKYDNIPSGNNLKKEAEETIARRNANRPTMSQYTPKKGEQEKWDKEKLQRIAEENAPLNRAAASQGATNLWDAGNFAMDVMGAAEGLGAAKNLLKKAPKFELSKAATTVAEDKAVKSAAENILTSPVITKGPINYWEEPGFAKRNPNFNPEAYANSPVGNPSASRDIPEGMTPYIKIDDAAPNVKPSWKSQELPGLHISATMEGGPISKIIEPKTVTDSKGNSWYEFDIPNKFKGDKGEIKAFKNGGWLDKYK
jgi:broad specificity phosphatase PhoE